MVDWDKERVLKWYRDNPIDLSWLGKPTRHHFRWRATSGRWISSKRRISKGKNLLKLFERWPPADIYVGSSSWLDPIDLPKLRDRKKPHPILLDHLVVFDIDIRPFCQNKIEFARKAAITLHEWIIENTEFVPIHCLYSGSKGFHLVYRDPERDLFAIEDPREREFAVRDSRKELVDKVLAAGHPIDPVVTADTRRIIRLPGTIHGKTGWISSIIPFDKMKVPFRKWMNEIPKHEDAIKMPRFANPPSTWPRTILKVSKRMKKRIFQKKKVIKPKVKKIAKPAIPGLELQASTHVIGTVDRNAILWWLPLSWGEPEEAVNKFNNVAQQLSLGPVLYWQSGEKTLAMIPRAIPQNFLAKNLPQFGLGKLAYHIDIQGHSWIPITPRLLETGEWSPDIVPMGQSGPSSLPPCKFPWSKPHSKLAENMGQPLIEFWNSVESNKSGSDDVKIRLAEMI